MPDKINTKTKEAIKEEVRKELEEKLKEEQKDFKHLDSVIAHINNVQIACHTLGKALMESEDQTDHEVGFKLIRNAYLHDNSKFYGIEWKYLRQIDLIKSNGLGEKELKGMLKLAHLQHSTTNMHHPEYWGDVKNMPPEYIAEMVCDLKARSSEFRTDLIDWVRNVFLQRHNLSINSKVYRNMNKYINLLLDKKFKKIT